MGVLLDFKREKAHPICSFMSADNFWIKMLRDVISRSGKLGLGTQTCESLMYRNLRARREM